MIQQGVAETPNRRILARVSALRRHRPQQPNVGWRRFLEFFSWIIERLDVPPNAPRELRFLPAVDVSAAFFEIPFRAEFVCTDARQAHGDASEVNTSSFSWLVADFDRNVSLPRGFASRSILGGREDRRGSGAIISRVASEIGTSRWRTSHLRKFAANQR